MNKPTFKFKTLSPELEEVLMDELHTLKGGTGGDSDGIDLEEVEIVGDPPEEEEEEEEEEEDPEPEEDPDEPNPWDDPDGWWWGDGNEPEEQPADVINDVKDPCIKAVVSNLLASDIKGKVGEILSSLDGNVNVRINVTDADYNSNGRPGMTSGTRWETTGDVTTFSTNVSISKYHVNGTTQEYTASVFMHEILHAYFRQNTGKAEAFAGMDHTIIAANYIEPMGKFLADAFDMDEVDATVLAWRGVSDTTAYKEATEFVIKDGDHTHTLSKDALESLHTKYITNSDDKGTTLCGE